MDCNIELNIAILQQLQLSARYLLGMGMGERTLPQQEVPSKFSVAVTYSSIWLEYVKIEEKEGQAKEIR